MDFHSLTRKALQSLCKQNGIPANLTNVAMADSLAALQQVEGLEELLNQSPEKFMIGAASVSRTAVRTTARRAPAKKVVVVEEGEDQGKTEFPPKTPAAPSTRRRAPAASACQKMENLTETTAKPAYSTRRSVRLLGKTMSNMSLDKDTGMTSSIEELSADTMDCSELSESSVVKVSENGGDASEVLSELKSEGKTMDDTPTKETAMKSEDCAPKTSSYAVNNSEVMDESSEGSSVDVKVTAEPAALQQVYEHQSSSETVELISLTLSSTQTKSPGPKISHVNVAATASEPEAAPKPDASGDYNGKFDFESGSSTEGDSEDECTEDELVDEASSELEDNITEDIIREVSEEGDSDNESIEGEYSEEEEDSDDINEEEFSEEEEAAVAEPSSPVVVNISTQLPCPATVKSSGKKRAEIISDVTEMEKDEDHKEVEMKEEVEAIKKEEMVKKFEAKSLRELKKLLKLNMEKLTIRDSKDTEVVEKPRIALKEVPENQMSVKQN